MNTIKLDTGETKLIAHRGLSGLERENTCSAFVAAGNRAGIFGIETDVHRTADGKFVLFHDDNTQRVGLDHLVLEETTFQTLRSLQLTDRDGTRSRGDLMMPTVEEYIGICKRYEKTCVFEFKNVLPKEDVIRLAEIFRREDYLDRAIFISFQPDNLFALREHDQEVSIQLLLDRWREEAMEPMTRLHIGLDINYRALTKELVDRVHAAGLPVNCWTVNDPDEARKLIDMGVDYITSDILESKL